MDGLTHYFFGAGSEVYFIQKFTPAVANTEVGGWYEAEKWTNMVEFSESSPESAYDYYTTWIQQNASAIGGARTRLITASAWWKGGTSVPVWADSAEGNTYKGTITSPGTTSPATTTTGTTGLPSIFIIMGGIGAVAVAAAVGIVLYKKMK